MQVPSFRGRFDVSSLNPVFVPLTLNVFDLSEHCPQTVQPHGPDERRSELIKMLIHTSEFLIVSRPYGWRLSDGMQPAGKNVQTQLRAESKVSPTLFFS